MEFNFQTVPELIHFCGLHWRKKAAWYEQDKNGSWQGTSWADLYKHICTVSSLFRERGLRKGSRIAVYAWTGPGWQTIELAGWITGCVIVGVDPLASSDSLRHIIKQVEPELIIADTEDRFNRLTAAVSGMPRTGGNRTAVMLMNDLLNRIPDRKGEGFSETDEDDPALIIFTSGTTGIPKGIEYTHSQVCAGCRSIAGTLPSLGGSERIISWLPLAHLFQQVVNILSIGAGAEIYFCRDPHTIMDVILEVRPTVFVGVPRFYEKLYEGIQQKLLSLPRFIRKGIERVLRRIEGKNKSSLIEKTAAAAADILFVRLIRNAMGGRIKYMITGTAPLHDKIMRFFHGAGLMLLEGYGISENTVPIAFNRPDRFAFGSVGIPLSGISVTFAKDGEILVKGPGLFSGYLNRESGTEFTPDGYYKTGDIGYINDHGFLFLKGRKSEIFKTSTGRKIAPLKVESILKRSPLISHAFTIGSGRKYCTALIVPAENTISGPAIAGEITCLNTVLAPHEQIMAFRIIENSFSVEKGEVTSSLKFRRHVIEENYTSVIEEMYEDTPVMEGIRV
ncbi:AMP-dependent synthetase/ligase [Planctomycetota bacterium]